ncbi:MAG: methionine adenosyltransferase [Bacilli bacterium]
MEEKKYLFTSESVTEGHPDKVADKISDSILDAYLSSDPNSHVACETVVTKDLVFVMGEIKSKASVDIDKVVRDSVNEIGYNKPGLGFDCNTLTILNKLSEQSPDINMGVENDLGAGDQGMMFGYACRDTKEFMPAPVMYSHKIVEALSKYRKDHPEVGLRPDGKAQVTVEYIGNKVNRIDNIVVSAQHAENVSRESIKKIVIDKIVKKVIPSELLRDTKYYFNPTGRFCVGGPAGDSGLTGRKIIVDTYGGYARIGGGAFSGKDPSKVDRSGAYMARYIAKNIVASGICDKIEIGLSYAIGKKHPTSIMVETYNTSKYKDSEIIKMILQLFPLTPKGMIEKLNLRKPIYAKTTNYGHFSGKDLSWEKTNMINEIIEYFNESSNN